MLAKYCVDKFIFYQTNCLLIDIFYLKLSLVNFNYDSVYSCLTPNALLHIAMCSARDALLEIVSIPEAGHTYKGWRIQGKCSYPCLTRNPLLRIVVCPARVVYSTWNSVYLRRWVHLYGVENSR